MDYNFDKNTLEIINVLIFDASINVEDLRNLKPQETIQFEIERRPFEDVKRKKFLFWNRTFYKGKLSRLIINGVLNVSISDEDKEPSNVFVYDLIYNSSSETLKLFTASRVLVEFKVLPDFNGQLIDIRDSKFGSNGSSIGKFGFTKEEWYDILREKNYIK